MKSKILPLFVVTSLLPTVHAATINWVGTTTGDWTTPTNWSSNAAPAAGNAYVASGSGKTVTSPSSGNATFAGDSLTVQNGAALRLSCTSQAGTPVMTIPGLTLDGATISPASPVSPFASVNQTLANQVTLANAVTAEMNDAGSFTNQLTFNNGYTGSGTLAMKRSGTTGSGRTININGTNSTAGYSGAVSTSGNDPGKTLALNISTASGWGSGSLAIGPFSSVTLSADVSGTGPVTIAADSSLQLGSGGAAGSLAIDLSNDGSVVFNRSSALTFGNVISGAGSVTQAGASTLVLAAPNTYTGGTTVSAGTLSLANPSAIGSSGTLTLKGGTLQFTGSNNTDYSNRIKIADLTPASASGASVTFDTGGRIVTFSNALAISATGTVSVTKTGAGVLSLHGFNTYTANTTVSAGQLDLADLSILSSPVSVASGATLSGSGTVTGTVTFASGSNLLVGSGNLTANGVTATTGVNLLPAAEAVALGANLLNVINYGTGTDPGTAPFTTTAFRNPVLNDDTGSQTITLAFTAGTRTWAGTTGTWDLGTSTPWTEDDKKFFAGDAVTFPDITADNVVTLTGTLTPSVVTITNNAAFNYTLSGTGTITGTTSLSKSGAGTLTMAAANTYTGGTTLNGGTLTAASTNSLGIGPVTLTSGTFVLNAATLPNPITGSVPISVLGTAQSTLSGDLSGYTGTVGISTTGAGKLFASAAATFPSSATVNVNSGTTFYGTGLVTYPNTFNLLGTGNTENLGALRLDSGARVSGSVVLGANASIGSNSGVGVISGVISGPFSLNKQGAGTVILSGVNTYTGATIIGTSGISAAAGTLAFGVDHATSSTSTLQFVANTATGQLGTLNVANTAQQFAGLSVNYNPNSTTSATASVTGTGSLLIQGASDFSLINASNATPASSAYPVTLDMTGLATFTYNSPAKKVSVAGNGNARSAILNLGASSTFTALSFELQNGLQGGNTAKTSVVNLGKSNTINADTLLVLSGNGRDNATMQYRTGLTSPSLTLRGTAGGTSRGAVTIGDSGTTGTSATHTATLDLSTGAAGSTLDAMVSTFTLGNVASATNTLTATFLMGAGTLDVTALNLGSITAGTSLTSVFTNNGGTVKSSTITFGTRGTGTLVSTLNLNSGGTLAATTIQPGTGTTTTTRTLNWNDGTISNLTDTTGLTLSVPVKLAATGTHTLNVAGADQTATVSGIISDATSGGSFTKAGPGKAILSGANTYTGDTLVTGGTLTLGTAYLAAAADVRLSSGGGLNLTFTGSNTIDALYIDGAQQANGTWGSLTSSATHKTARITGTGILQVTNGPPGYASWAAANAGGQAANLDFDNDGVPNGVEYFMGQTGSTFTPNPSVVNGTITWPKDPTATATAVVETSPDLATWTTVTATDNGTSLSYTLPTTGPKLFARLRVTVP